MSDENPNINDSESLIREKELLLLMNKLSVQNSSKYEELAQRLAKEHQLQLEINGWNINFRKRFNGITYSLTKINDQSLESINRVNLGWRKSSKLSLIPQYIALSEAMALSDSTN